MAASFYAPGAFAKNEGPSWEELQVPELARRSTPFEPPARSIEGRCAERPLQIREAAAVAAESAPAAAAQPVEQTPRRPAASSASSSFYPKRGAVGASGASVPQLPWTKQQDEVYADFAERPSSRERRHRSSWHAALNKRIVAMENAEDLLAMVNRELNGFDVLNTVTSLNRLSRLPGAGRFRRDHRALEILYRIEAWLTRASAPGAESDGPEAILPKHLASISIGLARLHWKDSTAGRILRMIAAAAPQVMPLARARDLSNLAWAFATLEVRGFDQLLLAIAREAVVQIAEFTEQNLSNTCWAYAKLGLRHDPLIKAIADETVRKLPQFSAQGLSNTLWGFATMVIKGEECLGQSAWQLICALLEELMTRLPDCPTQQLSNSAWACCRLGVRHDGFMAAIAAEGTRKLADYTPQDLANTSMAFAKPNIKALAFLQAIARQAARKIHMFEAREVSNITWSLNIMGPGLLTPEWLDSAMAHFKNLVLLNVSTNNRRDGDFEGWEMVQLLNAVWSYRAELRHWPELAATFRKHIYGPMVSALADIVGRDAFKGQNGSVASVGAEPSRPSRPDSVQHRLYSAGPVTDAAIAAAARAPDPVEPLDAARREAQRVAEALQVDFLGPVFTRVALRDLGFVDPADNRTVDAFGIQEGDAESPSWGDHARASVAETLARMRAELPFMWFDRFGPHERRVQCWMSYEFLVEVPLAGGGSLRRELVEGGRVADFSMDEHRAMCQHGCETFARLEAEKQGKQLFTLQDVRRAQQWLQGLFAQHDRSGHAERTALLEVVLDVIHAVRGLQQGCNGEASKLERCVTEGFFDGSYGVVVRGLLRLFVCHFYCISCLAAISNFARRFPQVTIHTDYDDCWKTRLLDV